MRGIKKLQIMTNVGVFYKILPTGILKRNEKLSKLGNGFSSHILGSHPQYLLLTSYADSLLPTRLRNFTFYHGLFDIFL